MKLEYIGAGLAAVGIGVTLMVALPPPWWLKMPTALVHAGLLVGAALTVGGLAVILFGIWPYLEDHLGPTALMALCVFGFVAGVFWYSWQDTQLDHSKADLKPQVFDAQFSELQEVMRFIGGKDENGLMQLFDFSNLVTRNIFILQEKVKYNRRGEADKFDLGPYLEGDQNQMLATLKVGRWTMTPSGPHVDTDPNQVAIIALTKKYQDAKARLVAMENSPLVPEAVLSPLKEFDKTVGDNAERLIEVLNEKFNEDDKYLTQADNYGSQYYGVVRTTFFGRFSPLKPKVDLVVQALRGYLTID